MSNRDPRDTGMAAGEHRRNLWHSMAVQMANALNEHRKRVDIEQAFIAILAQQARKREVRFKSAPELARHVWEAVIKTREEFAKLGGLEQDEGEGIMIERIEEVIVRADAEHRITIGGSWS